MTVGQWDSRSGTSRIDAPAEHARERDRVANMLCIEHPADQPLDAHAKRRVRHAPELMHFADPFVPRILKLAFFL